MKKRDGFTLIEVLVAVCFIIAFISASAAILKIDKREKCGVSTTPRDHRNTQLVKYMYDGHTYFHDPNCKCRK